MLNVIKGLLTFGSSPPARGGHIGIPERAIMGQVGVSARGRHPSRFSHMVRGGMVIGLIAAATGGIAFQLVGWPYDPLA